MGTAGAGPGARGAVLPEGKARAGRLPTVLPGLALAGIGLVLFGLATTQPLWLRAQVGPGLFAHALALGVIGLGAAWALRCALAEPRPEAGGCAADAGCSGAARGMVPGAAWSGPVLLGAVLAFALAVPVLGLVGAAGLAAALAARAAGERRPAALAATVTLLMALVALVGAVLLPVTAPLWPWS
jgi:hypothetical protein